MTKDEDRANIAKGMYAGTVILADPREISIVDMGTPENAAALMETMRRMDEEQYGSEKLYDARNRPLDLAAFERAFRAMPTKFRTRNRAAWRPEMQAYNEALEDAGGLPVPQQSAVIDFDEQDDPFLALVLAEQASYAPSWAVADDFDPPPITIDFGEG